MPALQHIIGKSFVRLLSPSGFSPKVKL